MSVAEKKRQYRNSKGITVTTKKGKHHANPQNLWWVRGLPNPRLGKPISEKAKAIIRERSLSRPNLEPSLETAYLAGAILGDGSLNVDEGRGNYICRIFTGIHQYFTALVCLCLRNIGLRPSTYSRSTYSRNNREVIVQVYSKVLVDWVRGLTINRLREFLTSPMLKLSFIYGFFDAEGSVWFRRDRGGCRGLVVEITNTNKELIDLIYSWLIELGFHPRMRQENKSGENKNWKDAYRINLLRQTEVDRFLCVEVNYGGIGENDNRGNGIKDMSQFFLH